MAEDLEILTFLENESYSESDLNKFEDVKSKIEEFSEWLNSIGRLSLLRCEPQDSDCYIYLLLNLKKKIKQTISHINRSRSNCKQTFTCNLCGEKLLIKPKQNVWTALQDHPHFEQLYQQNLSLNPNEELEECSTTTNGSNCSIDDSCSDVTLEEPQEDGLNNFRFNFIVKYDQKIEETIYPQQISLVTRQADRISEYTIQKNGANRAVCLLCPCPLNPRGRYAKISLNVIRMHIRGEQHFKAATTPHNLFILKEYHEFWKSQDTNFQAHQVHFMPDLMGPSHLKCILCGSELVARSNIIEHIKANNHKTRVIKVFESPDGKLNEYHLLHMQVKVYGIESRAVKTHSNGAIALPKCDPVKFVIKDGEINLPIRFREHLKFFKDFGDVVNCFVCKMNVKKDVVYLKQHILNPQHRQMTGVKLPKFNYFCEICQTNLKDEMAWDDHFIKGPNRHNAISELRRVSEYECLSCMLVLYGDEISVSRHIAAKGGKAGHVKELRLPLTVEKLFKSSIFINEEALRVVKEANEVLMDQEKIYELCQDLERTLHLSFPRCKAYPFGSRTTGLGNNKSDLDIFMDIGDMYFGTRCQDGQSQGQFVRKVAKILKAANEEFSNVVSIPSARTPIVKLRHNYTKLDCDISLRHGLGVENTKFLKFCVYLQPATQPFILLLKKWSEYCKLNEHINNYGLAFMAIFFLQTGGYLLSVKTVRQYNSAKSFIIDGWETLNYEDHTRTIEKMKQFVQPYRSPLKQLLRDFFFYFSKFDYANQVVCPLLGRTLPKMLFNENPKENLPVEMKSYVQRLDSEDPEQFRGLSPFCIQDPFDLSHNLTKACQQGTVTRLKTMCTLTYEFLETVL